MDLSEDFDFGLATFRTINHMVKMVDTKLTPATTCDYSILFLVIRWLALHCNPAIRLMLEDMATIFFLQLGSQCRFILILFVSQF